jgi:hypothetical protein
MKILAHQIVRIGAIFADFQNGLLFATVQAQQSSFMKTLIAIFLWFILLVLCWPLALVLIFLLPLIWLILLPFRIIGFSIEIVFKLIGAIVMFPFRLLGVK